VKIEGFVFQFIKSRTSFVPYAWVEVLALSSVQKLNDARLRKRFISALCRCWLVLWFCFSNGKNCVEYIIIITDWNRGREHMFCRRGTARQYFPRRSILLYAKCHGDKLGSNTTILIVVLLGSLRSSWRIIDKFEMVFIYVCKYRIYIPSQLFPKCFYVHRFLFRKFHHG
jgi:hypothetical protein